MDWRLTGNKPLSEPMISKMCDAKLRHFSTMNNDINQVTFLSIDGLVQDCSVSSALAMEVL